ncbi:MAG TPA: hypothetical protein VF598_00305 [Hymenobacter sp.]|jgi:hypothetical protein
MNQIIASWWSILFKHLKGFTFPLIHLRRDLSPMNNADQQRLEEYATAENEHWRSVAGYDQALKVFAQIRGLDLERVRAFHADRWHKESVAWFRGEFDKPNKSERGSWTGGFRDEKTHRWRKIQRGQIQRDKSFLNPPIYSVPNPVDTVKAELEASLAHERQLYTEKAIEEQAATLNRRKYLAERLKSTTDTLSYWLSTLVPATYPKPAGILSGAFGRGTTPATAGMIFAQIEYFRQCLSEFEKAEQELAPLQTNTSLSLRQVALLHIYQGKPPIKRDSRADEIAKNHGHTSGGRLYSLYNKLTKVIDRIGVEGDKIKPLIKDIEQVLPYLKGEQLKQAKNELQTLRAKIS